jgi:hypothetical protein
MQTFAVHMGSHEHMCTECRTDRWNAQARTFSRTSPRPIAEAEAAREGAGTAARLGNADLTLPRSHGRAGMRVT